MAGRAEDVSPAMESIRDALYGFAARQFDSQGAAGGSPWPANAPATTERKAKLGLDPRILHEHLRLRRSLTQAGGENVAVITGSSLVLDTTTPYAKFLRGKYALMGAPPERDRRQWTKILQRHVVEGGRLATRVRAAL